MLPKVIQSIQKNRQIRNKNKRVTTRASGKRAFKQSKKDWNTRIPERPNGANISANVPNYARNPKQQQSNIRDSVKQQKSQNDGVLSDSKLYSTLLELGEYDQAKNVSKIFRDNTKNLDAKKLSEVLDNPVPELSKDVIIKDTVRLIQNELKTDVKQQKSQNDGGTKDLVKEKLKEVQLKNTLNEVRKISDNQDKLEKILEEIRDNINKKEPAPEEKEEPREEPREEKRQFKVPSFRKGKGLSVWGWIGAQLGGAQVQGLAWLFKLHENETVKKIFNSLLKADFEGLIKIVEDSKAFKFVIENALNGVFMSQVGYSMYKGLKILWRTANMAYKLGLGAWNIVSSTYRGVKSVVKGATDIGRSIFTQEGRDERREQKKNKRINKVTEQQRVQAHNREIRENTKNRIKQNQQRLNTASKKERAQIRKELRQDRQQLKNSNRAISKQERLENRNTDRVAQRTSQQNNKQLRAEINKQNRLMERDLKRNAKSIRRNRAVPRRIPKITLPKPPQQMTRLLSSIGKFTRFIPGLGTAILAQGQAYSAYDGYRNQSSILGIDESKLKPIHRIQAQTGQLIEDATFGLGPSASRTASTIVSQAKWLRIDVGEEFSSDELSTSMNASDAEKDIDSLEQNQLNKQSELQREMYSRDEDAAKPDQVIQRSELEKITQHQELRLNNLFDANVLTKQMDLESMQQAMTQSMGSTMGQLITNVNDKTAKPNPLALFGDNVSSTNNDLPRA